MLAVVELRAFWDSRDPKHENDVLAMDRRGTFDARRVRGIRAALDPSGEELRAFEEMVVRFDARPPGPRRRPPRG
jgi:hypothetical protein